MIFQQLTDRLKTLQQLVQRLPEENYRRPSPMLGGASIGKHVRHILEVLQCLNDGYADGVVNYDQRRRDEMLENHPAVAVNLLDRLLSCVHLQNKPMIVSLAGDRETVTVPSSYLREINYNIEHAVHHFAMIHVALREMNLELVNDDFGKANSTIQYQRSNNEQLTNT